MVFEIGYHVRELASGCVGFLQVMGKESAPLCVYLAIGFIVPRQVF